MYPIFGIINGLLFISLPWKLLDLVLLVQDLDLHYYLLSKCKKYFHRCVLLLQ